MLNRKTILALLLAASFPTHASPLDFFVVVPLPGKLGPHANLSVKLSGYSLPAGTPGISYPGFDFTPLLQVTGDPSYAGNGVKWTVSSGSLPPGLTLNADGTLSGTPTVAGTSTFQVRATYKTQSGATAYQIVVANLAVGLAAGTPPEALVGQGYSYDLKPLLTVTGDSAYTGTGATWSVVSSTLPAGLYLTSDGVIAGTPTVAGTGSITARATYKGVNGEQTYQVVSLQLSVALAAAVTPLALVGKDYSYDLKPLLSVSGDPNVKSTDAKWSLIADTTLPAGLSLSPDGVVAGNPTEAGMSLVTVQTTYKNAQGQQVYTIVVGTQKLDVTQVVTGAYHTCILTKMGGVKCWGSNQYGQLGDGSGLDSWYSFVDVAGLTSGVAKLAAGNQHTCAITTSGGVKCWGENTYGQLGNGSATDSGVPVDVVGLSSGVAKVSLGYAHSCALTTTGGAKCWGLNGGMLGNNSATASTVPVDVVGLSSGVAVLSAGMGNTCAVTTAGGAKCWGNNGNGELGNDSNTASLVPLDVVGLSSGVAAIAAGGGNACALTTTGAGKCWGAGTQGELGNNADIISRVPVDVVGLTGAVKLVSGGGHYCALTQSGGLKCWGYNGNGQLGNNSTARSLTPVDVTGLSAGVIDVSAGPGNTCAVTSDNTPYCWGNVAGSLVPIVWEY